jgi:cyanophycinase-like exopeptidase
MIKGYLILNGGEAFSARSRQTDHNWLQLVRGNERPRVAIVPTAAVQNPEREASKIARYFKNLSAHTELSLIKNQQDANTRLNYEVLDKVSAIVLPDGSPLDLVERLQGTKTEDALHRALRRKAAVMATGASAMALGAMYWFANDWESGLGLAPHLAIVPHHNLVQMRLTPDILLKDCPNDVTLLGVDQATSLICHPDGSYHIDGYGAVTVYRDVEMQDVYPAGESFRLPEDSTPA